MATNFSKELLVKPGKKMRLADWNPEDTLGWDKDHKMKESLDNSIEKLDKLQYLLYAEHKRALLIVLQGLDAAGKDGTIRHVMSGVNPQGCKVTPFKKPSAEEAEHDFLWRIHKAFPEHGDIGIFNRSHYEDVLVVRVHELVPKDVWSKRYDQINEFEKMLHREQRENPEIFPAHHKDEQKKRFEQRIDDPDRRWKISASRFRRAQILGRLHAGLRRRAGEMQHAARAVVRDSLEQEMVPQSRRLAHHYRDSREHGHEIPRAHDRHQEIKVEVNGTGARAGIASRPARISGGKNAPGKLRAAGLARHGNG